MSSELQLHADVSQSCGRIEAVPRFGQHDARSSTDQQFRRSDAAARGSHDDNTATGDREHLLHAITAASTSSD
jgi:hypothetical protein